MCIRDSRVGVRATGSGYHVGGGQLIHAVFEIGNRLEMDNACLLYTSDAADDLLCVDLGGRRIIKKKNRLPNTF